ncbi:hypothetical protein Aspvir_001722 [Aspergillus viridinutans]|uniref:Uncharacterized protein n=1 Tax=Aspergillus viridinutans TaxID=75553 RepID=A0A9P3BVW5_ASPVI|nr:uncharacterized protein Aspvir_001722 [Aspergillus viridinutans]GIJ99588.1 hypothetical protein Aspvir_001722 [Aspergillus viridinutans]
MPLGRVSDPAVLQFEGGYMLHAPSPIPMNSKAPVPQDLDEVEIQCIIRNFITGTNNAVRAGFDG